MRASVQKLGRGYYRGALRDARGKIVWFCNHMHSRRDVNKLRRLPSGEVKIIEHSAIICASVALHQAEQGQPLTGAH
jgi:hypothetical protein